MKQLRIKTLARVIGGVEAEILNPDDGGYGIGGLGGCYVKKNDCTTTYTGPQSVECCCFYTCPSGGTWVCKQGVYCAS
jgi:hypothetical protein